MARMTNNQKVIRAIRFLLGLRTRRARRILKKYGLSEAVLHEGKLLLDRALNPSLDAVDTDVDPSLLRRLDEFENRWYVIIKAAVTRHHPAIAEWLFNNLVRSTGIDLVISISKFVERIRALSDGTSPFAEEGVEVMQLLESRGFTAEVMAEAEAMVAQISKFQGDVDDDDFDPQQEEEAVNALWAWYLEWSAVARAVIDSRAVLRELGFRRNRAKEAQDDAEESEPEPEPEPETEATTEDGQAEPVPASNDNEGTSSGATAAE